MEDNSLGNALGNRLCFEVQNTVQEVNQISSSLLDEGRQLLLCLLKVGPGYVRDQKSG